MFTYFINSQGFKFESYDTPDINKLKKDVFTSSLFEGIDG